MFNSFKMNDFFLFSHDKKCMVTRSCTHGVSSRFNFFFSMIQIMIIVVISLILFTFSCSFNVKNLQHANQYVFTVNVSLCTESSESCEIANQTILANSLLSKRKCQFDQQLSSGLIACLYISL